MHAGLFRILLILPRLLLHIHSFDSHDKYMLMGGPHYLGTPRKGKKASGDHVSENRPEISPVFLIFIFFYKLEKWIQPLVYYLP